MSNVMPNQKDDESCRRTIRSLQMLDECTKAMLGAIDEQALLDKICAILVDTAGYSLAWVGYAEEDADRTVRPVALYGLGEEYVRRAKISWGVNPHGLGPTGTAIRTRQFVITKDILTDPCFVLWQDLAEECGVSSLIAFPLPLNGGPGGALTICSREPDAFDPEEIALLEGLANNLSYGIRALRSRRERIRAEEALRQSCLKLQSTLEGVIKAMATLTELRDPYTAGHQQRVSELASAIAKAMGMSGNEVEGITIAGVVHDLGKVYVPIEILSKPGHLSAVEFDLVKVHSRAGYDILKTIEFPWPIAETVLQHHERVNGSGYPLGLTGKDILMSAKIVAVADVVEAMSCFRPYRPARGVAEALKEITRNRGILYDPDVVDACNSVFARGQYRFPQSVS